MGKNSYEMVCEFIGKMKKAGRDRASILVSRIPRFREEVREFELEVANEDVIEIAHEAADLVILGLGALAALDLSEGQVENLLRAIMEANLQKEVPPTGGQKLTKPVGWVPADCAKALGMVRDGEEIVETRVMPRAVFQRRIRGLTYSEWT